MDVHDALTLRPGESAGYLVRRALQRSTKLWSEEFGGAITGPQYAVTSVLVQHPGLDQRAIGRYASLDKSSTADIVGRLERDGWVVSSDDSTDGRRKMLNLTPAAGLARAELARKAAFVQTALLEPLEPSDRGPFLELLRSVAFAGSPPDRSPSEHGARPAAPTLQNAPGHLIRRAHQVHTGLWNAEVDSTLSPPQYAVLNAVAQAPEGIDQTTAGALSSLDTSSLADVVKRLARHGWLVRGRDAADGRRRLLSLTANAHRELGRLTPAVRRVQARLLEPLDPADQVRFLSGLRLVAYHDDEALMKA